MAAFRFRVVTHRGLIAGFESQEDAEAFAHMKSKKDAGVLTVIDKPHGGAVRPIVFFLKGEKTAAK